MEQMQMPVSTMPEGSGSANDMGGDAQMPAGGMPEGSGPVAAMPASASGGATPGAAAPSAAGQRVLVELRETARNGATFAALSLPGAVIDPSYAPVSMPAPGGAGAGAARAAAARTVVVRATVDPGQLDALKAHPDVVAVWSDGEIAPFAAVAEAEVECAPCAERAEAPLMPLREGMAACPIGTCDCAPGTPKGSIADVAAYLGVNDIWAAGVRGDGIVVGVVDGGIRAVGRATSEAGAKLDRVIGGWPAATWGTTAQAWGDHGMMCGTDVLGMAPNAKLYDLRISDGSALSSALSAFQWAIDRHRADGTPHVLTNSWGMFQQSWAPDYTTDPNHPFTRKVIEAIDEGILVLFAAGNCGATCPDGRCGPDTGPGRSIWGANGHPRVITVGAVNKNEQFVGYSSQGPAALDANKPDFCSVTHFGGYFASDSGTSAATPIAAGVVALLRQAQAGLTQDQARAVLKSTAKDIGPAGFDTHSGAGILRAKAAYQALVVGWRPWESLGGLCTDGVGVASWAPGRLDAFVVGNDRHLYRRAFDGTWRPWEDLGGNLYSNPAAVSWAANRIDVFAIGGNRAMWHRWWDGAVWRPWEDLGGLCTDGVGVSSRGPGKLDCFVVGNDRQLYRRVFDGGWKPWEPLGGELYSNPAAVSWAPNRIDVFAIGKNRAMWHRWWDGAAWRPWEDLGGLCTDGVGVSSRGPGKLDCFVVGNDRHLYRRSFDGSWRPWEDLGGNLYSNPAAVSWGANRIDVFGIGGDRAMWHRWYG